MTNFLKRTVLQSSFRLHTVPNGSEQVTEQVSTVVCSYVPCRIPR